MNTKPANDSITIHMPVDAVELMKINAPHKGLSGYQALLKAYVSEGLRQDEARYFFSPEARLIEALKGRGISEEILKGAVRELHPA